MATNIKSLHRRAKEIEEELLTRIQNPSSGGEVIALLQEYRLACETLIFGDLQYACAHEVEGRLWAAHLKANNILRQQHKVVKRARDHVVEVRKFRTVYLHFIKTSQRFYRQYILNLDVNFDGIPELRRIAQKWKNDVSRPASHKRFPTSMKDLVVQSCYQTLIHLGDLSRYRETELVDKHNERNWGPAKGHYELAAELRPDSGHAQNQLAVISREDGDHFRSIYHLYRSLACKTPYEQTQSNLEAAFKRVIAAWDRGELVKSHKPTEGNPAGGVLVAWFIRLHSKIYKGEEFATHNELEGEVLSHLAIELKERPLDPTLNKMILVNLAAEYFAAEQLQLDPQPPNILRTYFYYVRLNVKTFFVLLQTLQPELARLNEGDDVKQQNGNRMPQLSDKITAVARRILPGFRLYSTWFARVWQVLHANLAPAGTLINVDVQELWKAYAATLTLLASSFPVEKLPKENYMLEEDTDTIGFEPLISPDHTRLWYEDANLKPKWSEVERNHPNVEMLMRVKDLLIDGLILTQNATAPLDLDHNSRFFYREKSLPSEILVSPTHRFEDTPPFGPQVVDLPLFLQDSSVPDDQQSRSVVAASEPTSIAISKDNAMNRMVDDLVGDSDSLDPLPERDENTPPTPPEQTFEDTAVVNDTTFAPAPFSVNDLVNSVKNYKSHSPAPGPVMFSTPMGRTGSTASIRLPANLPSLPDGQHNSPSIWNRQNDVPSGPSSPSFLNAGTFGADMRSSPLNSRSNGTLNHGRMNSGNSPLMTKAASPLMAQSSPRMNGATWGTSSPNPSHWGSIYGNQYGDQSCTNGARASNSHTFGSHHDSIASPWNRPSHNSHGG